LKPQNQKRFNPFIKAEKALGSGSIHDKFYRKPKIASSEKFYINESERILSEFGQRAEESNKLKQEYESIKQRVIENLIFSNSTFSSALKKILW
jgi:hypothetical protein